MGTKFKFFPEDWHPDQKIMSWCRDKGLSDKQVIEQLEEIKDHEFQPMRSCPNRTFRRWIRNAIKWGHVTPSVQKEYREPEKISDAQKQADILAFENDPLIRAARRAKQ